MRVDWRLACRCPDDCASCDPSVGRTWRAQGAPMYAEPESASGRAKNTRRRVRRDVAALLEIRAKRALVTPDRPDRGAVYVVPGHEGDPYVTWRVNRERLTLRSASGGFAVFEGALRPTDEWWRLPDD